VAEAVKCEECHNEIRPEWSVCPWCEATLQSTSGQDLRRQPELPSAGIRDSVVKELHQTQHIDNRRTGGATVGGNIVINIPDTAVPRNDRSCKREADLL